MSDFYKKKEGNVTYQVWTLKEGQQIIHPSRTAKKIYGPLVVIRADIDGEFSFTKTYDYALKDTIGDSISDFVRNHD